MSFSDDSMTYAATSAGRTPRLDDYAQGGTATIDENRRLDDAVRAVQDAEHAAVLHSGGATKL